ncbi:hypothetical protein ZIOFF_057336 [Zingiber officinale]|uniref:Ribosomal protein L11 n=1 Tax=Zingiber officinale TaxID=94328 RepID=A0A8J5KBP9_ZINOF|nr:hypothetical protein ZIOFF_057336 [Zingiber officinale]
MLSNVETGIPGSIDPNLNRETTDNGKKWAVKRARTSFSGGRKKKSVRRISKETQLILDKGSSGTGEMPLSDSEKVGVSILGQHFSDSLKIVPIKKRRLLFVRSPSSPLQSSYSDYSDHLLESQTASESLASGNDHDKRFIDNKKPISKHVIEGTSDAADFSGISILAAAACNSEIVGEGVNLGYLVPTENSFREINLESTGDKKERSLCQKDLQLQSLEDLLGDRVAMETYSTSVPVEDENKFHDSQNKNGSSLQNVYDNIKSASVSRLHWDLNTDMDAWNSNCDDLVISGPVVTNPLCGNRERDNKLLGCETCEKEMDDGEKRRFTKLGKSLDIPGFNSLKEASAKPDIGNCSSLDHENVCSFANGNNLVEKIHSLDDVTVTLVGSSEEAKLMHGTPGINICCAKVISSEVGIALGSSRDGSLANEATKKVADKMDSDLGLKTEPVLYHAPFNENVTCEINAELDKPLSNMVQLIHKPICNENVNIIASSSEKLPDDNRVINTLVESSDQFLLVAACDTADGTIHSDKSDGSNNIHVDKPSVVISSSPSLVGHQQNSPEACNSGELIMAAKCENIRAALMVNDDNFAGCKSPVCAPTVTAVPKSVEELVVDIKETEAPCKSIKVVCQISHGDSHLDAFQVGDVVTEHEKSNLVGDDDSQFEDGEFRESVLHGWGEDDEVESEHVDYGSDNGENDISEAISVLPSSATLSMENMTFKARNLTSADEVHAGKDRQVIFPQQPSSRCSSKSDCPDAGQVKRTTADLDHKKHLAHNKNSVERDLTGCNNENDTSREPLNVRMKSSGWDRLPEGSRHAGESLLDHGIASTRQDDPSCSLRLFVDDESLRRSGSSFKGALSSRVEAPNSSDETCRKDKFLRSRYSGHDSLEAKAKRNATHNSSGWGGSSGHTQSGVRDEHWFDSPNSRGPRHHGSPGYYDPSSFARPSSRNAAAAAVKKVESNGFVVAPDGTLVKAGGATSAGRVTKKPVNGSLQSTHPSRWGLQAERDHPCGEQRRLQNSRDVSPDRHFTIGRGQTGRYVRELDSDQYGRSIPHDRTESSLSGHRLSTRDRSYSPNRRPLRLSHPHIRSRSRSRTRSPIRCTSPRGRHDIGVNNVPGFRRHRRSPVTRMDRMRSPNTRDSSEERMIFYDSVSTALTSPSYSTRWIDGRKESPNHLKEHSYKRISGRSPPMSVYNDHRLGSLESHGRSKPSDYFHSLQSSRNADFSRGYKYDNSDDRRGQDGRDNYLRSARQYDNNKKRISSAKTTTRVRYKWAKMKNLMSHVVTSLSILSQLRSVRSLLHGSSHGRLSSPLGLRFSFTHQFAKEPLLLLPPSPFRHFPLFFLVFAVLTLSAAAPPLVGMIKLALEAGKATPAPPVGPALGSKGVNIMAFCKEYNAKTADKAGYVIPVEITVFDVSNSNLDKSFTFILKTPPASVLLLKAAGIEKGSKDPQQEKVGKVTIEQLRAIATEKLPDLNCTSMESAMRIIAGTAANMGIEVDPPVLEPKKKAAI